MLLIIAFIWGFLGGLFVEVIEYYQKFKNGDFENEDNAFRKYYLQPCLISALAGGIVACAIVSTPTEAWAFVIGLGASSFIARFSSK